MITKLFSFNVQIWVGLRRGYSDYIHSIDTVRKIVDTYIEEVGGDCVTITETE